MLEIFGRQNPDIRKQKKNTKHKMLKKAKTETLFPTLQELARKKLPAMLQKIESIPDLLNAASKLATNVRLSGRFETEHTECEAVLYPWRSFLKIRECCVLYRKVLAVNPSYLRATFEEKGEVVLFRWEDPNVPEFWCEVEYNQGSPKNSVAKGLGVPVDAEVTRVTPRAGYIEVRFDSMSQLAFWLELRINDRK
jgi:hypothetical protein